MLDKDIALARVRDILARIRVAHAYVGRDVKHDLATIEHQLDELEKETAAQIDRLMSNRYISHNVANNERMGRSKRSVA